MGRELAAVRIDKKSNGANSRSYDKVHDAPRVADDHLDQEYEVKECTVDNSSFLEECHEKQEVLGVKSTNYSEGNNEKTEDQTSSNDSKKLSTPDAKSGMNGNACGNFTVPHPFALSTEKCGSLTTHQVGAESPPGLKSPGANNLQPSSPTSLKKPLQEHADEEDSISITSSAAASVRTVKSVRSRVVTVGSAPTFRSSERAEKRKEFYTKLDEKHRALEAERSQCEARTREEQEAAIKQLRKSMVVKANPVPSFYYEGPPPKVELKKLPLTRPKSPKLSRRKSCSDAVNSSPAEKGKVYARAVRHSLSSLKEESNFNHKTKSPLSAKSCGNGTPKARELRSKREKETPKAVVPCKLPHETDMNAKVEVQS